MGLFTPEWNNDNEEKRIKAVEKAIANHDKKILKMSNNSNMMMCVI